MENAVYVRCKRLNEIARVSSSVSSAAESSTEVSRFEMPNVRGDSIDMANWTPHAEVTFIGLSYEEVKKGNMQISTFRKRQWDEFEAELFSLLGVRFTGKQLKGKFNQLCEQHQLFSWVEADQGWLGSFNK